MRTSLEKHHVGHNDPITDDLPALTTARMKYNEQSVYEFVPQASEEIPACD
jgi:hypothetical protein